MRILILLPIALLHAAHADNAELRSALTIFASFDRGVDADFSKGDPRLYTWIDRGKKIAKAGLHTGGKSALARDAGRYGGAIEFKAGDAPWIYYAADKNLTYDEKDWSGTSCFWLRCDPVDGLAKGYCDPIQFTTRAWNDASFFVDFSKEGKPRDFRLGCFADKAVWNPRDRDVPEAQRPLLTARNPGFAPDKWVHVLFTWQKFNSGRKDAVAKLYLNGKLNGSLTGWNQKFSWKGNETARLLLGLHYVGLMDEFACFNRALTAGEVQSVHALGGGIASLLK